MTLFAFFNANKKISVLVGVFQIKVNFFIKSLPYTYLFGSHFYCKNIFLWKNGLYINQFFLTGILHINELISKRHFLSLHLFFCFFLYSVTFFDHPDGIY